MSAAAAAHVRIRFCPTALAVAEAVVEAAYTSRPAATTPTPAALAHEKHCVGWRRQKKVATVGVIHQHAIRVRKRALTWKRQKKVTEKGKTSTCKG